MLESLHWRIELIFKILLFVLWEFSDLLVRLWSLKFLKFLLGLVFRSKTVGCSMFMRLNELKSPEDLMKQDEQNSSSRCFHPSNDAWSLTLFFTHPLNSEGFAHHAYLHLCFCVFACPQDVFIWKTWVVFSFQQAISVVVSVLWAVSLAEGIEPLQSPELWDNLS